jgi:hypothetical protein
MFEETIFPNHYPQGEYQDILLGPQGEMIWARPWQHNLIVNGMSKVLAALLKGDSRGALFWAVGAGKVAWDSEGQPTNKDTLRELTRLYHETARRPILPGQIVFFSGETFSPDVTNQLEIKMNLTVEHIREDNHHLREFGLFANASAIPNSGTLLNHRIHARIDMDRGFTLQRTLHLTF